MTFADAHRPPLRRALSITRLFAAPRDLVFRMWTEPELLAQWWGPKDFTNPVCEVDLRIGGELLIVMRAPDGNEHPMKGIFREIVPPERLAFWSIATDTDGNHLLEGLTTVTFTEEGGGTKLVLHTEMTGLADIAAQMLAGMGEGWTQSIDRLGAFITRVTLKDKRA